ncbi:hypothetical protein D915_011210, partial [Fasciola hepatica]
EAFFADNEHGDISDPEGFVVAPLRSIQEAVLTDLPGEDRNPLMNCVRSPSSTVNSHDPFSIDAENPEFLRLHDHIAGITRSLRNNMQRLDLDLSSSAQPSHRGPSLDKALLRIVFSGCVATSAYIPCSGKDLYVTQSFPENWRFQYWVSLKMKRRSSTIGC